MPNDTAETDRKPKREIALAKPRFPYVPDLMADYGIHPTHWRALIDAIYPSAQNLESVLMALSYCKAAGLDPMLKPVHIVPVWNSALRRTVDTVWPGIGLYRTIAHRTGSFAGMDVCEFGPAKYEKFVDKVKRGDRWESEEVGVGFPEWARVTVYRIVGGQRVAFAGPQVFWKSMYGRQGRSTLPNERWGKDPHYMLEKCAEAAALRRAFPEVGNQPTVEESGEIAREAAEGIVIDQEATTAKVAEPTEQDERDGDPRGDEQPPLEDEGAGEEQPEPLSLVDHDGVEHQFATGDKWRESFLALMQSATNSDQLDGCWETNSPLLADERVGAKNAKIVRDAFPRFMNALKAAKK